MVGLAATGELTYNGYTFDGASKITVQINYLYDDADKTIIGQQHMITVEAIVANGDGLDNDLESIRRKLGKRGAAMRFVNKGFGDDLVIRGGGAGGLQAGLPDIRNGPKPRTLSWVPIGDNKAAEIVWTVEVTVALCLNGPARTSGVAALNYGATFAIDSHGMTTRTLQGYLDIVAKAGSVDTPDKYRETFAAEALPGFTRTQNWTTSPDRRRLDFTIVDTEIPSNNPWPNHVTSISGSHRFKYRIGQGGVVRQNTISMRIAPEAGKSGALAWVLFRQVVAQRTDHARRKGNLIFLDSLEIEEDLFGRAHNLSVSYRLLKPLKNILGDTGLWVPLKGTNWQKWALSLNGTAFNFRGSAKLADLPSDVAVIDLCEPLAPPKPASKPAIPPSLGYTEGIFINKKPPKESSYIDYKSAIMPSREHSTTRQQILQKSPTDPDDSGGEDIYMPSSGDAPPSFETGEAAPDVILEDTAPAHSVTFAGRATRAGYEIPRPSVKKVGGRDAHPWRVKFWHALLGELAGVKIWTAAWQIQYILDRSPGLIQTPPNRAEK